MNKDFEYWWEEEGHCLNANFKDISKIAWLNGGYKAIAECIKRAEAYSYMSPNFSVLADEFRNMLNE